MARASVPDGPGGAKSVTGFEGGGESLARFLQAETSRGKGANRNLLSAGPPSNSLGWRKETQAKAGWARGQRKTKGVENKKLKPCQA